MSADLHHGHYFIIIIMTSICTSPQRKKDFDFYISKNVIVSVTSIISYQLLSYPIGKGPDPFLGSRTFRHSNTLLSGISYQLVAVRVGAGPPTNHFRWPREALMCCFSRQWSGISIQSPCIIVPFTFYHSSFFIRRHLLSWFDHHLPSLYAYLYEMSDIAPN